MIWVIYDLTWIRLPYYCKYMYKFAGKCPAMMKKLTERSMRGVMT